MPVGPTPSDMPWFGEGPPVSLLDHDRRTGPGAHMANSKNPSHKSSSVTSSSQAYRQQAPQTSQASMGSKHVVRNAMSYRDSSGRSSHRKVRKNRNPFDDDDEETDKDGRCEPKFDYNNDRIHNDLLQEICSDIGIKDAMDLDFLDEFDAEGINFEVASNSGKKTDAVNFDGESLDQVIPFGQLQQKQEEGRKSGRSSLGNKDDLPLLDLGSGFPSNISTPNFSTLTTPERSPEQNIIKRMINDTCASPVKGPIDLDLTLKEDGKTLASGVSVDIPSVSSSSCTGPVSGSSQSSDVQSIRQPNSVSSAQSIHSPSLDQTLKDNRQLDSIPESSVVTSTTSSRSDQRSSTSGPQRQCMMQGHIRNNVSPFDPGYYSVGSNAPSCSSATDLSGQSGTPPPPDQQLSMQDRVHQYLDVQSSDNRPNQASRPQNVSFAAGSKGASGFNFHINKDMANMQPNVRRSQEQNYKRKFGGMFATTPAFNEMFSNPPSPTSMNIRQPTSMPPSMPTSPKKCRLGSPGNESTELDETPTNYANLNQEKFDVNLSQPLSQQHQSHGGYPQQHHQYPQQQQQQQQQQMTPNQRIPSRNIPNQSYMNMQQQQQMSGSPMMMQSQNQTNVQESAGQMSHAYQGMPPQEASHGPMHYPQSSVTPNQMHMPQPVSHSTPGPNMPPNMSNMTPGSSSLPPELQGIPPDLFSNPNQPITAQHGFFQHIITDRSSAFHSHPLFPLLRDLIVADMNFHMPTFPFKLIANLPSDFDRLLHNYLQRNQPRGDYNGNHAIESVVMDALKYAHKTLTEKIMTRRAAMEKEGQLVTPNPIEDFCERFDRAVQKSMSLNDEGGSYGSMQTAAHPQRPSSGHMAPGGHPAQMMSPGQPPEHMNRTQHGGYMNPNTMQQHMRQPVHSAMQGNSMMSQGSAMSRHPLNSQQTGDCEPQFMGVNQAQQMPGMHHQGTMHRSSGSNAEAYMRSSSYQPPSMQYPPGHMPGHNGYPQQNSRSSMMVQRPDSSSPLPTQSRSQTVARSFSDSGNGSPSCASLPANRGNVRSSSPALSSMTNRPTTPSYTQLTSTCQYKSSSSSMPDVSNIKSERSSTPVSDRPPRTHSSNSLNSDIQNPPSVKSEFQNPPSVKLEPRSSSPVPSPRPRNGTMVNPPLSSNDGSSDGDFLERPPSRGAVIKMDNNNSNTSKKQVLPKEAVVVMTAWLREHQDNPYPNDDEKDTMMAETGLTINQINYWFTNARRRILPKWTLQRILEEQARAKGFDPKQVQVQQVVRGSAQEVRQVTKELLKGQSVESFLAQAGIAPSRQNTVTPPGGMYAGPDSAQSTPTHRHPHSYPNTPQHHFPPCPGTPSASGRPMYPSQNTPSKLQGHYNQQMQQQPPSQMGYGHQHMPPYNPNQSNSYSDLSTNQGSYNNVYPSDAPGMYAPPPGMSSSDQMAHGGNCSMSMEDLGVSSFIS